MHAQIGLLVTRQSQSAHRHRSHHGVLDETARLRLRSQRCHAANMHRNNPTYDRSIAYGVSSRQIVQRPYAAKPRSIQAS